MTSEEKAKLYNETLNEITRLLLLTDEHLGDAESLSILSKILKDYDLDTAANLVRENCEPSICKWAFEDKHYDEGNEEAGFIELSTILNDYEKILNCDDSGSDIHFKKFIRYETDEEKEEEGHSSDITWFTEDERRSIEDTYLEFEDE